MIQPETQYATVGSDRVNHVNQCESMGSDTIDLRPHWQNARYRTEPAFAQAYFLDFFGESPMNVHIEIVPVLSLIAGILILIMPRILNYVVAIYLIVVGVVGLMHMGTIG
jgi:hypothetical protein